MKTLILTIALIGVAVPANALIGGFLSQSKYQLFYLTRGAVKKIGYYDDLKTCKKYIKKYQAVADGKGWKDTVVTCGLTDYGRWKKWRKTNGRSNSLVVMD